jgi:acetyl-CoA carboxylase biotin carboxylase subunit
MFQRVLVANRGEVAVRIARACRTLGIAPVGVVSEADRGASWARAFDEIVCIGPAPAAESYLRADRLVQAALQTRCAAVHPGWGFLAESARFAALVAQHGLVFVGPRPAVMELMGAKTPARRAMQAAGLPLVPGSDGPLDDVEEALRCADDIGYPVLLKADFGGGGRGMRRAASPAELRAEFGAARAEAEAAFGDGSVYLERYLTGGRHVEIQVLCDDFGRGIHVGERECSVQRKHQKLIEESPSPALDPGQRSALGAAAVAAALRVGYTSAGTLEFLLGPEGTLHFMEMNTRLQVEHPVTELVTGIDLVESQIRVAAGEEVNHPSGRELELRGHAIECRINAEDPRTFAPWPGLITEYNAPGGRNVRVDSGVHGGIRVPNDYDPMLAKLITHGATRAEAIARMRCALDEFIIGGIRTNIPLHKALMRDPDIIAGTMSTRSIERLKF